MLFITWDDNYVCCIPDWALQAQYETDLTYFVAGPKGGMHVVKARLSAGPNYVDLDYHTHKEENGPEKWEIGVTRITLDKNGQPLQALWKSEGEGAFSPEYTTISYDPAFDESELIPISQEGGALNTTSAQRLIQGRIGQGEFRKKLLTRWNGRCALTGISAAPLLEAAHLKPWSTPGITDEERLSVSNGLLLSAHVHTLFDSGLLTFDGDGNLEWATSMSADDRATLALPVRLREPLNPSEKQNLSFHRMRVFGSPAGSW